MKPRYILFDFDGVIVDSFAPAYEVKKMMCPHVTADDYRRRFEGNINDWEDPANTHTVACRNDVDFFAEYIPRFKKMATVVPGIQDVIRDLSATYTLIIISSTVTSPIQEFLAENNMASYFTEIMGNDVHTSKIEKINMVFAKYDTSADQCIFITDTLGDLREAAKVNVGAIGVTWGFHDAATLTRGNPFRLVQNAEELPGAIEDYFDR